MRIDLHTHSNVSDGTEDPAAVMAAAHLAGLGAVALTDHDSTAGWGAAARAAARLGIAFVPGMEVSCRTQTGVSVHILSYLQDPTHPGLLGEISHSRASRLTRAQRMVELLAEDFPISWEIVQEHVAEDATIGRPHIADALVSVGVIRDRSEAFTTLLTARSRYWIGHYAPDPVTAVALIRAAGGVPVFAHPAASARGTVVGEDALEEMIAAGLLGLEVDHRDNPEPARARLRSIAVAQGLFVTGSSDYHGRGKPNRLGEHLTDPLVLERIESLGTGTPVAR